MWPGGMKTSNCPCCKICTTCPGFQKVLDKSDAGFVLYRHVTRTEDINTKPDIIESTSDIIDDVFIIENTQCNELDTIDFTPEIDRNQISCPRCANILKHAQRLLKNRDIGKNNIVGVCEHCREKTGRTCLKCDKIVEKFELSKSERKQSYAQRIKSWVSKIHQWASGVEDKGKEPHAQIKRRHSDIDISKLFKKISETDHEPKIEDLLDNIREFNSGTKRPLSERSYFPGVNKGREIVFYEPGTPYKTTQNEGPFKSTPQEGEDYIPVHERRYDNYNLLHPQSNITLIPDELEKDFINKYGKSYKEKRTFDDPIARREYISTQRSRYEDKDSDEARGKDRPKGPPLDEKYEQRHDFSTPAGRLRYDNVSIESQHYKGGRKGENIHSDLRHEGERREDQGLTDGKYEDRYKQKEQIPYSDLRHEGERREDHVLADGKYDDRYKSKERSPYSGSRHDAKRREDEGRTDGKYDDQYQKQERIPYSDIRHEGERREDHLLKDGKYDDQYKKKERIPYSDLRHEGERREGHVFTDGKYDDRHKSKERIPYSDLRYEGKRREDQGFTDGKYDDRYKKNERTPYSDLLHEGERRKSYVADGKYEDGDKKKERIIYSESNKSIGRQDHVSPDLKHYKDDRERELVPHDTQDRKKEGIPISVSRHESVKGMQHVPSGDKHYEDGKRKEYRLDSRHEVGKRRESSRLTQFEGDKKKDYIMSEVDDHKGGRKAEYVLDDVRKRERISTKSSHYGVGKDMEFTPSPRVRQDEDIKRELMMKAGIRHDEETPKEREKASSHDTRHSESFYKEEDFRDEKPKGKKSTVEAPAKEGFISAIGKRFEEEKELVLGSKMPPGSIRKKPFISVSETDIDDKSQMEFDKNVPEKFKDFIPAAVRRYTREISTIYLPKLKTDLTKAKQVPTKILFDMPLPVKRYHSQESLLAGLDKMQGEIQKQKDKGFDLYFPEGIEARKKKKAKAQSLGLVSSTELIKDTIDKMKLKREEAKRQHEEEKKERERLLNEKLAKQLETQKEAEREKELESKKQDVSQKKQDSPQEEPDTLKKDSKKRRDVSKTDQEVSRMDQHLSKKDQDVSKKDQDVSKKDQDVSKKDRDVSKKDQDEFKKDQDVSKKDQDVSKKDQDVSRKDQDVSKKDQDVFRKDKGVSKKDLYVLGKDQDLSRMDKGITKKDQGVSKKDQDTLKSEKDKYKEDQVVSKRDRDVSKKDQDVSRKQKQGDQKDQDISNKQEVSKKDQDLTKMDQGAYKKQRDVAKKEQETHSDNRDFSKKEQGTSITKLQDIKKKGQKQDAGKREVDNVKTKEKKVKEVKPEESKTIQNKDKEEKVKAGKQKDKVELGNVGKAFEQEAKERERLINEQKKQKEEEKRLKLAADQKAAEAVNQRDTKEPKSTKKELKQEKIKSDLPESEKLEKPSTPVPFSKIKIKRPSIYDFVVPKERPKERKNITTMSSIHVFKRKTRDGKDTTEMYNASDLELDLQSILRQKQEDNNLKEVFNEVIIGEKIYKFKSHLPEPPVKDGGIQPELFRTQFDDFDGEVEFFELETSPEPEPEVKPKPVVKHVDQDYGKGVVQYALSDRTFIDKGWTMLPTEKVVRKMNVYRMRPAHPEFDWFEHNKKKGMLEYDTGERLAEFDEEGRGRWYYRNGKLALDYYNAEEMNAQQRFVVYSSGEPDERGRTHPRTVLATFDYLGNGVVFDHAGKIRLKYNQTEGVVLDRTLGPVSHWKWHTLNDPPVLQRVMIDTQMAHKDPQILKLGGPAENKPRPDDEEMLAIEFDNFIKEKSAKLSQSFKPFQIKMKALKINENFSLRVLDQATVYLLYRDGSTNIKLNIGMILDHKEIVDTDTAEVGEVSNNAERLPARTDSLAELQRNVANAQRVDRSRTERERRLRRPEPMSSADRLTAAASRPMKLPLRTVDSTSTVGANKLYCKCRKPMACNVYYDTSI